MNKLASMRKESRTGNGSSKALAAFGGLAFGLAEHLAFFQSFIREPASVGALSPSSQALARAMIDGFSLSSANTVVELGPGTGAFTHLIRENIAPRTTFVTLELDPLHVRTLRRRFAGLTVYNESAERLLECLALHGKKQANYIVSGLPWANVPVDAQSRILDVIVRGLAPDGVFTTFAYCHARCLPKARQFQKSVESRFEVVEVSPVIWRNLPPAIVYRCSRTRKPAATGTA
jgi:phospholipid N-methyltransferase